MPKQPKETIVYSKVNRASTAKYDFLNTNTSKYNDPADKPMAIPRLL